MRLLNTVLNAPLAGALGWTLIHSLWEGAIIAGALGTVLLITRSARFRYVLACSAMLALAAAFALTLVRMMPAAVDGARISYARGYPVWQLAAGSGGVELSSTTLTAIVPWLPAFWIVGVCFFYSRFAAGWVSVRGMRRRGVCAVPEYWQQELRSLMDRFRISRPVVVLQSCATEVPVVIGHLRPVILLPVGLLAGLPAEQVEAILLHELAHIRRYDYLVNVLQRAIEGLFFYHPLVWWISRVIRSERENCCDDLVVGISGDAYKYAAALAALEQSRWSGQEPAVAATGGNVVKRVHRLLYPKGVSSAWTPLAALLLLIATATIGLAAWQAQPAQQSSGSEPSPYQKWLNEDVAYIIADPERAAFQKLASDDEREKFIQQFWERRDPTPATPENEFKNEHYRRIGYANQRFRTPGRPGSQTDRGHMYIVYGPPDEIESHPSKNSQRVYPYEVWMYRHIDGIGQNLTFTYIDKTESGDYRLAPGNGH